MLKTRILTLDLFYTKLRFQSFIATASYKNISRLKSLTIAKNILFKHEKFIA